MGVIITLIIVCKLAFAKFYAWMSKDSDWEMLTLTDSKTMLEAYELWIEW